MNDTEQLFKYDLKSVEKVDKTHLKVECESDLFVDLDDEWHVSKNLLKFTKFIKNYSKKDVDPSLP